MRQSNILLTKHCLLLAVFLSIAGYAGAQSSAYNYVVTYSPRVPITAANTLQSAAVANVNQIVSYFDGLGRPIQTVQTKASPSQRDLVQPMAYDQYDREAVKYLPYSDTATSTGYGNYKTTAYAAQAAFYASPTGTMWNAPGVVQTAFPTSSTNFEASPLNRVLEQGFAGDNWQLTGTAGATSPGHTVKTVYACNNSTSLTATTTYWARHYAVLFTYVTGQYNFTNRLADSGAYAKDVLYLTVSRNENWSGSQSDTTLNTTQEYKDKFGQVVLKRTFNYNTATSTREVLSTYYVYDEYGRLTYVLPPSANPDSGAVSQRKLDNLCYQYVYDGRGRMIKKKIPGKGWDIMIYNNLNQVIGTQDSVNRMTHPQRVLYTKYDPQGRTITTGYYTITGTSGANYWSTLQASANAETTYWETKSSTGVYSNNTIPTTSATALATNYYDDYNISGLPSTYTVSSGVSVMTRGLPTASTTAVLNTPADVLWDVSYYDDLGRDIESYSQHYLGGHNDYSANNYDLILNYYNFTNQTDTTIRKHFTKANTTTAKMQATVQYDYDQVGRALHTTEQLYANNVPETAIYLNLTNYNEIGQVTSKNIGGSTTSGYPANVTLSGAITSSQTVTATNSIVMQPGFSTASGITFTATIGGYLQTIGYAYNERGWLTALTPGVASPAGGTYAEQIYYNSPTGLATPQYNGNISQFSYNGPQMELHYSNPATSINNASYTYDNLNRLTQSQSTLAKSDETANYDLEGNIKGITRNGEYVGTYTLTYPGQSNQLTSEQNGSYAIRSFAYDGNGNTTTDSVWTIHYNLLDLPDTIKNGSTIVATYYYDAAGNKLRNVSTGNGTWDYISGIVYQNIKMDFVSTEEGRAYLNADSTYHYEYDLKDYLGNVRASYDSNSGALQYVQENDYYPFGLTTKYLDNANGNRYLYNGKEQQTDLTNVYDYGARFYDPVIARWMEVDPLAEDGDNMTPYNYVEGNPIGSIDPDGMQWITGANGSESTTDPNDIAAELGYLQGQADVQKVLQQTGPGPGSTTAKSPPKPDLSNSVVDENGNLVLDGAEEGGGGTLLGFAAKAIGLTFGLVVMDSKPNFAPGNSDIIKYKPAEQLTDQEMNEIMDRIDQGKGSPQDLLYEGYIRAHLTYSPTIKHDKVKGWAGRGVMDLDDETATTVLKNSTQYGNQRYSYYDGKLYEFQDDNAGGWHGYRIPGQQANPKFLKSLRDSKTITNAAYNKFIKQSKL